MTRKRRECKPVLLALLLTLLATAAYAQEDEINVVGLSQGKAVVTVGANPRPRVLRDGDSLAQRNAPDQGDARIGACSRSTASAARSPWATRCPAAAPSSGSGQVILTADERGHFVTTGTINGGTVQFLVDTGATMISMGRSDARRVGINYLKGQKGLSNTANGVAPVYKVKVDTVRIGEITLNNVDALVHDQDMPWVLLGMSFLNRVEMRRESSNLTLIKRY